MAREHSLADDERGAALVEFALALPILLMLMFAIVGYGQYFAVAHAVQQIANDAARSTVAGLTPDERRALMNESVAAATRGAAEVKADRLTAALGTPASDADPFVTVTLRYDAGDLPLMRAGLVPMPPSVIERHAVIRRGGFP